MAEENMETIIIIYLISSLISIIASCILFIIYFLIDVKDRKLALNLVIFLNIADLLMILPNIPLFIALLVDDFNISLYDHQGICEIIGFLRLTGFTG